MIPQRSPSSPSASHRHNNNRKMIQWVSRPVGFVAMLVVVSVLAFMHRFRETTEPQLILASTIAAGNSASDQSSRAMMATGDDMDRTHNRLREDVKKELFAPDNSGDNSGEPAHTEEKEPDERQVMAQLKAELAKLKEEVAQMKVERDNENNAVKRTPPKAVESTRGDGNDNKNEKDKKQESSSSDKKRARSQKEQEDNYKVNDNKVNWTFEGADKEEEEPTTTEKPASKEDKKADDKVGTRRSQREAKKEADRKKNEEILKERVATLKSQKKEDTQDDNNNNNNKKEIKPKRPRDPDMNLGKVPADPNDRPVYFLKWGEVNEKDAFSASWLQRKEEFLRMDLQRIQICEDAAFRAFKMRSFRLRMTLDWLDFSLEHLSKWWKMLKIFDFQMVFDTAKLRFDNYLAQSASFPMESSDEPSFRETIAVIAFQQYKDGKKKEQSYQLTKLSLAATIESLRRAGMGRVVVVGRPRNMDPWREDPILCQDTFRHMKELVEGTKVSNQTNATMVGHMEVAFAEFNETEAKTKHLAKNVPKATLVGLKQAFDYSEKKGKDRTAMENEFITTWLGEQHPPAYWKYIYLTEPDSILQTRPGTLKRLKEEVDKGMVLVPHRLQPIPHELDAPGHPRDFLYLPKDLAPIVELDAIGEGDSCCDYHRGSLYKPGQPPMMKGCGNFWYMCDFSRRIPKANRTHDRIRQYPLIKLKSGTEIVSLSALEHGRPCKPQKNAVCLPPTDESQKKRPAIFNA